MQWGGKSGHQLAERQLKKYPLTADVRKNRGASSDVLRRKPKKDPYPDVDGLIPQ